MSRLTIYESGAMLDKVLTTMFRYSMLAPGDRVLAAVSGGPDSVCLLSVLCEVAGRFGASVAGVAHLNHKLRGEASDEDERFVAALAAQHRVPFYREAAAVGQAGGNLEQTARRKRLKFFARLIGEGKGNRIATGHTRDDQAETVLFRLLRGSGLAGLAGILPVTQEGLIRPLLDVGRAEVVELLRVRGLSWREDASNHDRRFARNRIRHDLLPQLAGEWNPEIARALGNLADLAGEEERWWQGKIERLGRKLVVESGAGPKRPSSVRETSDGPDAAGSRRVPGVPFLESGAGPKGPSSVRETGDGPAAAGSRSVPGLPFLNSHGGAEIRADALAALPVAVSRRLVRCVIRQTSARVAEFDHVEKVIRLASSDLGSGRLELPELLVERSFDWIRFTSAAQALPPLQALSVKVPGRYRWGDIEVCFEVNEKPEHTGCVRLKWKGRQGRARLELRGWRAGDHYRPWGRSRDQKIQEMFQKARIPSWKRSSWPIVTSESKILWAREFGAAEEFVSDGLPGPSLWVWEEKNGVA